MTTDTLTLAEFLLARIAEDEAVAQAAWDCEDESPFDATYLRIEGIGESNVQHMIRHDPARVLAECEAKRRTVEMYLGVERVLFEVSADVDALAIVSGGEAAVRAAVQLLASVYADHPDFREEWRP